MLLCLCYDANVTRQADMNVNLRCRHCKFDISLFCSSSRWGEAPVRLPVCRVLFATNLGIEFLFVRCKLCFLVKKLYKIVVCEIFLVTFVVGHRDMLFFPV